MGSRKRARLTTADARAYVQDGGARCPYCGGKELQTDDPETEEASATLEVSCKTCRASWRDLFVLAGIDVIDEEGEWVETLYGSSPAQRTWFNPTLFVLHVGAFDAPAYDQTALYGASHPSTLALTPPIREKHAHEAGIQLALRPVRLVGVQVALVGVFAAPHEPKRQRRRSNGSGETKSP